MVISRYLEKRLKEWPLLKTKEIFLLSGFLIKIGPEVFGLVNVEAMACGVPVIATNIGGMPEVIEHGRTGCLINTQYIEVELSNCVIQLLNNPKRIKRLGLNSIDRVKGNFTWENSANRILQLYNQIVSGK
ncbi:glycosyltransferase [Neobacillus sp. BF23-41]|uniref:glycosyltransferase n=1 Tax=Neobacillus sp. BF23-41 TaxID=3240280 RepID=UPI0034E3C08D